MSRNRFNYNSTKSSSIPRGRNSSFTVETVSHKSGFSLEEKHRTFSDADLTDKRVHFQLEDTGSLKSALQPLNFSTPVSKKQTAFSSTESNQDISDQDILNQQTRNPNDSSDIFSDTELSVSRSDLSAREVQTTLVTGLPSYTKYNSAVTKDHQIPPQISPFTTTPPRDIYPGDTVLEPTTSQLFDPAHFELDDMGNNNSSRPPRPRPKDIISERPQEILETRKRVLETEVTGNCRPWSDHVYYKLFLDTEGRNATLMVLKCEISYVDVFTDEERSLYKARFIGGKADGVAQLFVFDLMKSKWEENIPQSQAIELNVDIVMSSSPIHGCSETLLNLLKLEKTYLKHRNFDGQLNVMIRFAHSYGWDVRDDAIRERVHDGLRNLFKEGVNLEVMSADIILEELQVDGILATDDERIKHYVAKRHSWTSRNAATQPSKPDGTNGDPQNEEGSGSGDVTLTSRTLQANDSFSTMGDNYHLFIHTGLWDILQDTKRTQHVLDETLEDF